MSRLTDALQRANADGFISTSEWTEELKPEVAALPKRASADSRALLRHFESDEFRADVDVKTQLMGSLASFGYDMATRPPEIPVDDFVEALERTNVSAPDAEFARLAAAAGKGSGELTIAVLDVGFDDDHPALQGKVWTNPGEIPGDGIDNEGDGFIDDVHGWNYLSESAELEVDTHGTHVTGLATAGTDRIDAITHVVAGAKGGGTAIERAIDDAAARGARIMNLSFRVNNATQMAGIVAAMRRHPEVLFVKSAGNDGSNKRGERPKPGDPGDLSTYDASSYLARQQLPNMAVISNGDRDGKIWRSSNWGVPYSTHAAVGGAVYSSVNDEAYDHYSGTSMSSPTFVNAAAKMLLLDGRLTPEQLKQMLADTTDVSEDWRGLTASGGMINAVRAERLAALTGLVRRGVAPQAAADRLGLGEDRELLLRLASRYVAAA